LFILEIIIKELKKLVKEVNKGIIRKVINYRYLKNNKWFLKIISGF
jgi:hypothetical protein